MSLTQLRNLGIVANAGIATTKLGEGAVLQIVQGTHSTEVTTTSTSYVTTNLSASITPSSASNKILIIASTPADMGTLASNGGVYGTNNGGDFTIYRDSTALLSRAGDTFYTNGGLNIATTISMNVLDSPSTTSSTTYSIYMKTRGGSPTPTVKAQHNGSEGSIILMEIKA